VTVMIAGGGIAGLTLGLTCHQLGIPFKVFESVPAMKPLGVGINLQPNGVRELFDLGLKEGLNRIGVETRDYSFYTKTGLLIWEEERGLWAGYKWPQFSVHRGHFQMLLLETLIERAGMDCVVTDRKVVSYETTETGVVVQLESASGERFTESGKVLVAADGIHSAIRSQMYPQEGAPVWNSCVLWRATSEFDPFKSGASMFMAGNDSQRIVAYPITPVDPATGKQTINWIAEVKVDPDTHWAREDWNRTANKADFAPLYADWKFDWIDIPALIDATDRVYEYPMVDREPLDSWLDGNVVLIGDAAHATYPVGSNGAVLAIIDARKLGQAFREYGVNREALSQFEAGQRPLANKVVTANRARTGPDAVMQMVEDRCGGNFDRLEQVISHDELAAHAEKYKQLSGMSVEQLNQTSSILPV